MMIKKTQDYNTKLTHAHYHTHIHPWSTADQIRLSLALILSTLLSRKDAYSIIYIKFPNAPT